MEIEGTGAASRDGEGDEEEAGVTAQREWLEKDYYAVLGVSPSATDKELSRAFKKLAKQLHPDANPGNAEAEERFKEIAAAYDILSDPRCHINGAFPRRRDVLDVRGFRRGAGLDAGDVSPVPRRGDHRRRPGSVLLLAGVPDVRWTRSDTPAPVPDL